MEDYRKIAIELGQTLISKAPETRKDVERMLPELREESEDERIRMEIVEHINNMKALIVNSLREQQFNSWLAWLEKQGENPTTLPKWKYKKDNAPLLRDSLILNKYGCVAKSPSGAIVSDVWVIDYNELAKLPKEESEKQGEQKSYARYKVGDTIYYNSFGRLVSFVIANIVEDGTDNPMYEDKDGNYVFQDEIVEQKPADKVEPKFKVGDKIYLKQEYRMPDDDTPIANTVFEIRAIDDKHYKFDGSYIFIEDQDKYELVEQNPAWSEEDEEKIKEIKIAIYNQYGEDKAEDLYYYFLEPILYKVQPQPKQEWSEFTINVDEFKKYMEK